MPHLKKRTEEIPANQYHILSPVTEEGDNQPNQKARSPQVEVSFTAKESAEVEQRRQEKDAVRNKWNSDRTAQKEE